MLVVKSILSITLSVFKRWHYFLRERVYLGPMRQRAVLGPATAVFAALVVTRLWGVGHELGLENTVLWLHLSLELSVLFPLFVDFIKLEQPVLNWGHLLVKDVIARVLSFMWSGHSCTLLGLMGLARSLGRLHVSNVNIHCLISLESQHVLYKLKVSVKRWVVIQAGVSPGLEVVLLRFLCPHWVLLELRLIHISNT